MATSYHLLHLCCYVLFLAICSCLRAAAALSFDYNFSVPGDLAHADLLFMGDTSAARDRINLTNPTEWSTGRVAHRQLVRLWDIRTGKAANFTTSFSFAIDRNSTDQADGMAFFVGPPQESLPPDMTGGFLGLVPNSTESPRTVGVEFDTCRNLWDPQGNVIDHIGVDVNNITSNKTTALKDLSLAGTMWAEIMYDAKSTTMAVTLRLADGTNHSLETVVDLKAAGLPQDAAVGFSAATGNLYESHQLLSWSFHSVDPSIPPSVPTSRKKRTTEYILAGTSSSLFGICIFVLAVFLWRKKHHYLLPWQRGPTNAPRIKDMLRSHPQRYTYSEVRMMTKSFAHHLGKGGYGTVYKGSLSDGREIAVKMLNDSKGDGEEFENEVASISRTSHINVVSLLGFCLQGSKRALIYEYMPNGSLEQYAFGGNGSIQGENSLSWEKLLEIVVGIARGLEYLHCWCNHRVVHFDIKPQNILLDQDFRPKIADFGLAKLCKPKESKISIGCVRGTIGYIAPEVFQGYRGKVTTKSDVYSYGMVVLEMVGARKNINVIEESGTKYFPEWLYDNVDQFCAGACEDVSDDTTLPELVRKLVIVGLQCIQSTPEDRPSMSEVIEMLDRSTCDLQLPPRTACCENSLGESHETPVLDG